MPYKRKIVDSDDEEWLPASDVKLRKLIDRSAHSREIKRHCHSLLDLYEQDQENNGTGLTAVQTILKLPTGGPVQAQAHGQLQSHGQPKALSRNTLINLLEESWQKMEQCVYGHKEAKLEVLRYHMSRVLGTGTPTVLGLVGPPGVGKTSLVVNGIAKALNLPLFQMSLGGQRDVTYFTGSLPCWKGSHHGVFADILIKHGRNALVYIDEVDKVAKETAGDVYGWLTHALDPLANNNIKDSFLGVPLDLSGLTFIFSYNDSDVLPDPLRDRIKEIYLAGFSKREKIHIVNQFIWPECLRTYGLTPENIVLSDDVIADINKRLETSVTEDTEEEATGVRNLKKFYQSLADNLMLRITTTPEGFASFINLNGAPAHAAAPASEYEKTKPTFMTHIEPLYTTFPYSVCITDI